MSKQLDKIYYLKQEIKSKSEQIEFARKTIWLLKDEISTLEINLHNLEKEGQLNNEKA